MERIWSGPRESPGRLDPSNITELVQQCLSRSQLKDLILLKRSNAGAPFPKLIAIVAILEEDYKDSVSLRQFGLNPAERISYTEETKFSRMDRDELEKLVLDSL